MQHFFDTLMRVLVEHPEYIEQIEHWDEGAEDVVIADHYALT